MAGLVQRVMVVGLDMGDGDLIRTWMDSGVLPNLARLTDQGTWTELTSTATVLHTSTWPSFATGDLPGKHGVYYPYQPTPGHQEAQLISPEQYGSETFWARADRAGRRCLVYDVPETFPEESFSGRSIFEWGVWAWYGERKSQPEELMTDIKNEFGIYPLKMEAKKLGLKFPDPAVLEQRLVESVKYKAESFQWLLDREPWDLAVMVFGETHPVGHYLWPKWQEGMPDPASEEFESVKAVYVAIDEAIGKLADELDDDVTLMVVSGDGVRPNHCAWHMLPEVLEQLGYSGSSAPPKASVPQAPKKSLSLGTLKDMVPPGARRFIADNLPWWLRDMIGAKIRASKINWSTTRAFALPTDLEGVIRINLKGREPNGIVEPGEDYRQLCAEIASRLRELVNPDTNEPAVRDVWVRNDVFPGPKQEDLPDLMITWNDSAPFRALSSPRIGLIEQDSPDPRTGTHSTEGFLLTKGPNAGAGVTARGHLTDVAATVLELLSVSAQGIDGKPLNASDAPNEDSKVIPLVKES